MTEIQNYKQKSAYMSKYYREVSASELYADIFPPVSLEIKGEDFFRASNPIFTYKVRTGDGKDAKVYFRNEIVFADTFNESIQKIEKNPCALCSMISYSGRNKTAKNAFKCHGFIIDLDGVRMRELENFWGWVEELEQIPYPTYVINSGHGLHIYYVFQNPVPLYPSVVQHLQDLKRGLTEVVWNRETSSYKPSDRQYQGIYQSFRMVGSRSKLGRGVGKDRYLVRGWRTGKKVSFYDLNKFVDAKYRVPEDPDYASWEWKDEGPHYSLAECKDLFPDWYERRIVKGEAPGQWTCHRGLYEWWLRKIQERGNAMDGNRFHCVSMLYVYGIKCSIHKELVDADAYGLIEQFNELTVRADNTFTAEDVRAASQYYDTKYAKVSRDYVQRVTRIEIPANKRNGQMRSWHLEDMRTKKANMKRRGQPFKNPEGRPDKADIVHKWQQEHPGGKKADCCRDTGLSKPTVFKWWQ